MIRADIPDATSAFHPIVAEWFRRRFAAPTEPQIHGWPPIAAGRHTLIAAPTGSGKTLTAFLAVLDRLLREGIRGELPPAETRVIYISPLRALSNDMHRNLQQPLTELADVAAEFAVTLPPLRVGLRTGDSTPAQRAAMLKRPPHIIVSTPESLYLLLTTERGRDILRTVDTVIVDEIHALIRDKRGSHLALTLERLQALTGRRVQRIGLSATQKPLSRVAQYLLGQPDADREQSIALPRQRSLFDSSAEASTDDEVQIVDVGHARDLDLAIETPMNPIGAVCTHENWDVVNARLVELIRAHHSTLIFVNTRRLAERLSHQLTERLGPDEISSHHGSLSAELRLKTERRLKSGELKAVVATASLELGLDIGYIDLVVQIGSPRSIATFLQRVGRSGHSLSATPKGRLIALTRDELLECMALVRAIRHGRLDTIRVPEQPLDVLAQHIVAETACQEWDTDALFALCRRADPFRELSRAQFDETIKFLSEGMTDTAGRAKTLLYHDRIGKRLRARPLARQAAIANAGAIPEIASYRVVALPEQTPVGSVDEDFAVESQRGDIFQLGNTSWMILGVRGQDLQVLDAEGAPPSIPFWFGEGPGRTWELSEEVSQLRTELEQRIGTDVPSVPVEETSRRPWRLGQPIGTAQPLEVEHAPTVVDEDEPAAVDDPLVDWLVRETSCSTDAASQTIDYVRTERGALGLVPKQEQIVFERFFDQTGGMQLVIHAPFGASITRAWGYALRKRFCRSFDFELQATADDDGIILSLGPQHSFPIEALFGMLTTENVRALLEQAILVQPPFQVRWRWNVIRALLVLKQKFGKKVPPALQRFLADDLLTSVFPHLTGCQENHVGDIELPDHPLVRQTMDDCLHEALNLDGLIRVLGRIERGEIQLVARDTREPSPFCYELLNASPYAFLDGGEIQERRARAVAQGSPIQSGAFADLCWLDPLAIAQVDQDAAPLIRRPDELHDFLLGVGLCPIAPPESQRKELRLSSPLLWEPSTAEREWFAELVAARRACAVTLPDNRTAWVATERWPVVRALNADWKLPETHTVPADLDRTWEALDARQTIVRGWLELCGPIKAEVLADHLQLKTTQVPPLLEALEGEGLAMRGRFTPPARPMPEETDAEETALSSPASEPERLTPEQAEWCHRRLLARIHRLTLAGLRKQIEPVDLTAFQRFLFQHHGLTAGDQRAGTNGLYEVISLLQGCDIQAIAWERDILASRLLDYDPQLLDELCLTGEVGWCRLYPPTDQEAKRPGTGLARVVPISLFLRADQAWLRAGENDAPIALSGLASELAELLAERGALFAHDLLTATRMLPQHFEEALGELIARGVITADTFAGLRTLIAERTNLVGQRVSRQGPGGTHPGLARRRSTGTQTGRWSLAVSPTRLRSLSQLVPENPAPAPPLTAEDRERRREQVEAWAWQLVRRWGVVFRDLLTHEPGAPRWWELLGIYRRLEARGELRGGRFISGVSGEQFALETTVQAMRRHRDPAPQSAAPIVICGDDPLNLTGLTPNSEPRIPGLAGNLLAYRQGQLIAARISGEMNWHQSVTPSERRELMSRFSG